ncbi:glycosyltransferase family 2 protein [Psychromarinibacter sp. C21-152]|uniref:Glycosyltransferase family 2 protein n=1 Tax=Psychromarinibacter sediminicola TaxID=3033385 RepID=A0AAE3T731_9RHOB|nr:glycosyltransferase family 2 protein [Psychromarinibacter sediminicola]MDF0599198.1 glycosyltransferase family 2 protein [Psychromarinibacter sediminicola]
MSLPIVASLWIGGSLSFLERVCLKSFVDHGHRTILYTYGKVAGVPEGVEVLDANRIFPNDNYIRHAKSGSPAVHADAFRYRMIELQNVIWIDADILCMQPWDFRDQWVFGWEKPGKLVCNAVLGLPRFSKTLKKLNALCETEYPIPPWAPPEEKARLEAAAQAGRPVHVSELEWGVWGPSALTHFLNETGEMQHVLPQMAFYPISFRDRRDLLVPGDVIDAQLDAGCYGVHLWNRRLRRRIVTHENGVPHPDSFLGRALARHGIDTADHPIPDVPPGQVLTEREEAALHAAPRPSSSAPAGRPSAARAIPAAGAPDPSKLASQNPNVTARRPAALAALPVTEWKQSADYQRAIDELEGRTGNITGWLTPPEEPVKNDNILIVTSMKNEAPFILEWIAYHLGIGATHFLVYTNDCTDNTNAILDRLQALGHVTRKPNPWDPASGKKPQHEALNDAVKQDCYRQADWVLTIDVDEFVNIHVGDGTFADLFRAANYPNVISFTWKFFGNRGVHAYEDRPVTEQFTACAPEFIPKPRLGWGFKSMVHSSAPYARIGVHRPLGIEEEDAGKVRWVNGSGRAMPDQLLTNNGWRSTKRSLGYRLATLNHYVLRSTESFLVKRERGRINHTEHDQGLDYWTRRNYATETDDRIVARHALMRPHLDAFLADDTLRGLHADAVAWHKARIAYLKDQPDYRQLFDDLRDPDRPDALFIDKSTEELQQDPEEAEDAKAEDAKARAPSPTPERRLTPAAPLPSAQAVSVPASALDAPADARWDEGRAFAHARGGFHWEGPDNALMFVPNSKRLVVTFDNIHVTRAEGPRWPWGFDVLFNKMGASVLGVMGSQRNWFRHDFVHDSFEALAAQGFFERFDQVLFYGASMGGFGALTYQRLCPGANVLAIAPQSTMRAETLPDEDRWRWTQKLDWSARYEDAAGHLDTAGRVWVIGDPYFRPDYDQIVRLMGDNVTWLRTPFMGHQLPNAFLTMGMLKDLLYGAMEGTLDAPTFYRLFRARRDLPRFQHDLLMHAEERGKLRSALRICEYTLKKRDAGNIKRTRDRLKEELAAQGTRAAAE